MNGRTALMTLALWAALVGVYFLGNISPDRIVISGDDVEPLRIVSKPERFQMEVRTITNTRGVERKL